MPYSPLQIANGFLERGFGESVPVDHMKVQKLLFFAHGYYLALTDGALINENFQAWKFGPVVPSIYHRLKKYGSSPITEYSEHYDERLRAFVPATAPEGDAPFNKVREFVWATYGRRPSTSLSSLTHKVGGAWDTTIRANPNLIGPPIPDEAIKREFAPLVTKVDREEVA